MFLFNYHQKHHVSPANTRAEEADVSACQSEKANLKLSKADLPAGLRPRCSEDKQRRVVAPLCNVLIKTPHESQP